MIRIKQCLQCHKSFDVGYRKEIKFCAMPCANQWKSQNYPKMFSMETHSCWKGGRYQEQRTGYIKVRQSDHRYAYEHRVVMEKHLGRKLTPHEDVHHINGKKDDNQIDNLVVLTKSQHTHLHHPVEHRSCKTCQKLFPLRPSQIFCSSKCAGIAIQHRIAVSCGRCNKLLFRTPHNFKRYKKFYCSRTCYDLFRTTPSVLP